MAFFEAVKKTIKNEDFIVPRFKVQKSDDLMVRGGGFYAIWDDIKGLWIKDEYFVVKVVDETLARIAKEQDIKYLGMENFDTNYWSNFKRFMREIGNNSVPLDSKIIFADQKTTKQDYASFKLDYSLAKGTCRAWDELVSTLYSDDERAKIEWAIGAILSGDAKRLQKFLVFYGPPGSGKSTIMNVIERLFQDYCVTFDAKQLGSNSGGFATGPFASNPLVAIQHDGDLSRIDDNTKINSIVSHDLIFINEKYVRSFPLKLDTFLMMGTNQPVKISDAKSGIIRRLIAVQPTGNRIESDHYFNLMNLIDFELGAIAYQCLRRYEEMGFHYYDGYKPFEMMLQTDVFLNFIEYYFDIFKEEDGISLKRAYTLYKEFCEETLIKNSLPQYRFREELKNYFREFHERKSVNGSDQRSYYEGFEFKPSTTMPTVMNSVYTIDLLKVAPGEHTSVFDEIYGDQLAQYANDKGLPRKKWEYVKTKLSALDTSDLHYVKVPENHIVIDFDLVDETGEKSLERNIEEALKWPPTYTELSKSEQGLHLHYIYENNVYELASKFSDGIEVKTLLGDSSLRRKLTKCNNHVISVLTSNLPKKERKMLDVQAIRTEKGLRDIIERNLRKEIHPGTKPSVDFILKILEDAYASELKYDVQDMRPRVLSFAAKSSHHSSDCIKMVMAMPFVGKAPISEVISDDDEESIVFFDVEVYSNLFVVCWKSNKDDEVCAKLVNPTPKEIEQLLGLKLVGFNNRRYDNHILYARYLGYSNEGLYDLSQKIIVNNDRVLFSEAFNLSYSDVFDFSSKKQSLKKFEIELGIRHMQLDIPWDQPVKDKDIERVIEYCCNDVIATQKTFHARKQDFIARKIMAELSGLSVNHTTQNHAAKIIFGDDKHPQEKFVYTNLATEFPGYKYDSGVSTYRDETTGEGGYVYAEPGLYEGVALLDVTSMHPTSIERLNLFGPYTPRFVEMKEARIAIKHKDYDAASKMLDGKLFPFLVDKEEVYDIRNADALAYALKIVINIIYGLTSASFDNAFRDRRNKDNIVAKRGALFMIDLKHAVQEQGYVVAHIKTDSIKIPNATPEIIRFVIDFGQKYGYEFEHETTYEKFCLINNAVYVARETAERETPEGEAYTDIHWTAVGAQFQHPYVFKKLFTHEELTFDDICETKSVVQGAIYLDPFDSDDISDMVFVGSIGRFVPVKTGGGNLWRIKDGKQYAVSGTKGYRWIRSDVAQERFKNDELDTDLFYFEELLGKAQWAIDEVGAYEDLIN